MEGELYALSLEEPSQSSMVRFDTVILEYKIKMWKRVLSTPPDDIIRTVFYQMS